MKTYIIDYYIEYENDEPVIEKRIEIKARTEDEAIKKFRILKSHYCKISDIEEKKT